MILQNNKKVNPIRNSSDIISNGVKILLTGGGTGGSVSPLLAVVEELTSPQPSPSKGEGAIRRGEKYEFLWVGTKSGPEREMVERTGIKFIAMPAGKLRRYFSLKNFLDPFKIIVAFFKSFFIILKWRPDLVMTAGSFVSVPVIWAAWILRVPILVHQQDARPGLANKLMAPFARVITITFSESLPVYGKKAVWTGNPIQLSINNYQLSIEEIYKKFDFKKDLPIVLIVGGGTGAMEINKLVWESLDELTKFCQIVHVTGKGKEVSELSSEASELSSYYKSFEFLEHEKVMEIMKAADLVVSRAGLGFLTEISYLAKPAILIPIPSSHQEDNAQVFAKNEAAIVLDQKKLTNQDFTNKIKELLADDVLRNMLRNKVGEVMKKGANEEIARIVERIT